MNKQIVRLLGLVCIPVGALLLNACGPQEMTEQQEVVLDEAASDSWIFLNGTYSEYGHCNNAIDDNGNGLIDSYEPDCHINPGPLRDLSVYDFPVGHNYFPDVRMDLPGGPGYRGRFRDPDLITRWFRFLNEVDGNTAGIEFGPGFNPEVVPVPLPLPGDTDQGTTHQGNNNDISIRALHVWDMFHPAPPPAVGSAAADAPKAAAVATDLSDAARYEPKVYTRAKGIIGGWPGGMYDSQGSPFKGFGSQGAVQPARTGNPDGK